MRSNNNPLLCLKPQHNLRQHKRQQINSNFLFHNPFSSDKRHYENIIQNVPFEVPEGWCWKTLGEVGIWQAGGTPSRTHKEYYGGNIPWLKTGDLNDGYISDIPEFITEEAVSNSSAKLNPSGSVLIAMYGATIGKLGILTFPATTNQACCACIKYEGIEQKYLFYFLMHNKKEFIRLGGGGAQPNISKEIIVKTMFPIPPINEQKRIVAKVEDLFSLIDELDTSEDELNNSILSAKSKILDLAIRGKLVPQDPNDEPASELLKRINPKISAPCDNPHYENTPFVIPDGWCWCGLGTVVDYEQPQAYIVESTNYSDSYNTPVLTAGKSFIIGYTNEKNGIFSKPPVIIFDDFTTDCKYVDFCFKVKSSAMKILHVKTGISIKYVYYFMSITRLIGETHKRYWISEYSKILIPLPPLNEQKRIVAKIEQLFSTLDTITTLLK